MTFFTFSIVLRKTHRPNICKFFKFLASTTRQWNSRISAGLMPPGAAIFRC